MKIVNQISNDELLDLVNKKDEVIETIWKSEIHKDSKMLGKVAR